MQPMRHHTIAITIALSLLYVGSADADKIDDVINAEMKRRDIPGLSLAIIEGGKIVKAKGYGVTEKGGKIPVTPSTLFQAASISKPVTAIGALHLVEQGKLGLDADVNTKLTSWKVPENEFTQDKKVTLRGILSHSAGLTVHGFPGYASGAPNPTLLQILNGEKPANTAPIRVAMVPGSVGKYSGGGYTVMQQMIIDVTAKPFPDFMRETVLAPLNMRDSAFSQPLSADKTGAATTGHSNNRNSTAGRWHTYPEMAAAGLWTTPSDLARFAIGIQQSLAGTANPIISAAMTREMLTMQKIMGLGLALDGSGKSLAFSHGGRNEGFDSRMTATAETGQGAVIMFNANDNSRMVSRMLAAISKAYQWPALTTSDAASPRPVKADQKALARFSGRYDLGGGRMLMLTRDKGQLLSMADGLPDEEYLPVGGSRFFSMSSGEELTFLRDDKGLVSAVVLKINDREKKAARIAPLMQTLKPQADPNPVRTEKLNAALVACAQGGSAIADSAHFAAATKRAFGSEVLSECVSAKSPAYLHEQDVPDRAIERHDSKVKTILFYKVSNAVTAKYLLIYLDADGLVADVDLVDD